jgi:hypothetical protein
MKLKEKHGKRQMDVKAEWLVRSVITNHYDHEHCEDRSIDYLAEMFGRLLDRMDLSDQQKLDIIEPYSNWELDK